MTEHVARTVDRETRWVGIGATVTILAAGTAYGVVLTAGFLALESPNRPIGEPYFSLLEILILVIAPAMVALMAAIHAWAAASRRVFSLIALCFMTMLATVTSCVHFVVLTLGRQPRLSDQQELAWLLTFQWPSLVYVLDILAWDLFFPLSLFFAALVFQGRGTCRAIRIVMVSSAALTLAGLAGVVSGDMQLRNLGIAGYLGLFLVVNGLLLRLFLTTDRHAVR